MQYYVLKDQVSSIFRRLPFKGFFIAILLGCVSSVWVRYVFRFVTAEETFLNMTVLAISALLFSEFTYGPDPVPHSSGS